MKTTYTALVLALLLTACAAPENNDTAAIVDTNTSNMASGTQLAGTPMQTETEDGQPLVGGDAVASEPTAGEASFTVIGGNFYYDLDDITVQEGDEVTITFKAAEGTHDFVLDEFGVQSETVSGDDETTVTFTADKKGTFEFYCSIGDHRAQGMVGTLTVE